MPNRVTPFNVGDRVRTINCPGINRDIDLGVEFTIQRLESFYSYGELQQFAYWPVIQAGVPFTSRILNGVWHGELELAVPTGAPAPEEVTVRGGRTVEVHVKGKFYTHGILEIDGGELLLVIDPDNFPDSEEYEEEEEDY